MINYFISDLHLSPASPALAEAFKHFVDTRCADADALYILGDFFDSWIGDDEDHPFFNDIRRFLKSVSARGIALYFQHGNRDFLTGERFATACGLTLLPEIHPLTLGDKSVVLLHGDSLCTTDEAYMAFRAQVRNPAWQQSVLALPLQQRREMAAQLRTQSQSMNSNKAEDIMDVNPVDVDALIAASGADILLHGHTHRPARHLLGNAERIVLGDWHAQGWYVRSDEQTIELIHFDL